LEREADRVARIVVGTSATVEPGAPGDTRIRPRDAAPRTVGAEGADGADGAAAGVPPARVRRSRASAPVTSAPVGVGRVQRAGAIGPDGGDVDADSERLLRSARRAGGEALDARVQQRIGGVLGADGSGVRLHEGDVARDLNDRMSAQAFTIS